MLGCSTGSPCCVAIFSMFLIADGCAALWLALLVWRSMRSQCAWLTALHDALLFAVSCRYAESLALVGVAICRCAHDMLSSCLARCAAYLQCLVDTQKLLVLRSLVWQSVDVLTICLAFLPCTVRCLLAVSCRYVETLVLRSLVRRSVDARNHLVI